VEDGRNLTYVTPYGNLVVDKDRPFFVRLRHTGEETAAVFAAKFRSLPLLPGNGSYSANQTTLRLYYTLYRLPSGAVMGNMSVSVSFLPERNKITARFTPASGRSAEDFQVVWLGFTTHKVVVTADPAEPEKELDRMGPLDNNDIGDTGRVVTFKAHRGAVRRNLMDFADAQADWERTFAGQYQFGDRTGSAAMVVFKPGRLVVDPALVAYPSTTDAAKYSTQRKTFFDGERYWLFWYDGGIKYISSADGIAWSSVATDIPQNPGNIAFSFTVVNIGRLVALVWVGKDGSGANKQLLLITGQVEGEMIKWSTSAPRLILSATCTFTEPATATFTSQGQLAIAHIQQCTSPEVHKRVLFLRYTCSGAICSSGTYVSTRVDDPIVNRDYTMAVPVAFNGDNGTVAIFYAATDENWLNYRVDFASSPASSCDAWYQIDWKRGTSDLKNYFAAAPSGGRVVAFYVYKSPSGGTPWHIKGISVFTNCAALYDSDVSINLAYEPLYVSAGTQPDGMTLNVFWSQATLLSAGKRRLHYGWTIPNQGAYASREEAPWAASYEDPLHISTAALSSRFAPLVFATVATNPAYDYLYFSSYPLPVDSSAAPSYLPWGQSITSPGFAELGGSVNPANGLLFHSVDLVSLPGRAGTDLTLSMIYRQPGLYFRTGSDDLPFRYYAAPSYYGRFGPGMHLDLPWLDLYPAIAHLPGGSAFFVAWDDPSQPIRWFNNTRGIRFTLKYDNSTLYDYRHSLTMPSGSVYNFDAVGKLTRYFASGDAVNFIRYYYDGGSNLYQVTDAIGRTATITRDGQGRVTQIQYGAQRVSFSYVTGCSLTNSEVMTLADVLGRTTKYTVCNYLLTKVEFPTGGRVDYTYAVYGTSHVAQGTDVYGLPLLQSDVYHESGAAKKTRSATFSYKTLNGQVLAADLRFYDGFGALQGVKEFRYQLSLGSMSTRVLDASNQVLHFDMQSLQGTQMQDLSGNGNHGTIFGTTVVSGKWGSARNFNGASDYISVPRSASLEPAQVTVTAWVKPTSTTAMADIVDKSYPDTTGSGYVLWMSAGGGAAFAVYDGDTTPPIAASGPGVLSAGTWSLVVGTFDGFTVRVYVDGVERASTPFSGTVSYGDLNRPLIVGANYDHNVRFFPGVIDEVRVHTRALTPNEMSSLRIHNAIQRAMDQNWYSVNDQPHLVETFAGEETEPSVIRQDFVDDWGNTIYSRDASGNETFKSFANTNHQGHFFGPGSMKRTTDGRLYSSGFDLYSHDWTVVSGSPTLSFDDAVYRAHPPSLRIDSADGTHVIEKTFASTPTLLLDVKVRLSSTASILGVSFLSGTDVRGAVQFFSDARLKILTYYGYYTDCFWSADVGGGVVTYASGKWYRLTVWGDINGGVGGQDVYSVYLDGIDVCTGYIMSGTANTNLDRLRVDTTSTFSAWVDEFQVSSGDAIAISGLAFGERAYLYSADRTEIADQERVSTPGATVTLSLNPAASTLFYPNGQSVIRVFSADGTLQYESPQKRFFGGDSYAYTHPKVLDDLLVRTTSGYGRWTDLAVDEPPVIGTSYGSPSPWQWIMAPSVSGTQVHESPFSGYGSIAQEHGYYNGWSYLPASGDFHVQYVYMSGQPPVTPTPAPAQILLKFGDDVDGPPINWVGEASWGMMIDSGPAYTKNMGWLPFVRDGWIQLIAKANDLGTVGRTINSLGYEIVGGRALWDASALADSSAGTVQFTGLRRIPGFHRGLIFELYWANNNTYIAGWTSAPYADTVSVQVYPKVTAFPVFAQIVIRDYDGYILRLPAPRHIWGGDVFEYVEDTGFYTAGEPSYTPSSIHTTPAGSKVYFGDCLDAVLCYDLQSILEDPAITLGTGAKARTIMDWSPRGNAGSVTGTALSPVPSSAAGLATSFDGLDDAADDLVRVSDSPSVRPETALTVSAWFRADALAGPGQDRSIVRKYHNAPLTAGYRLSLDGDQSSRISWRVATAPGTTQVVRSNGPPTVGQWVHVAGTATAGGSLEMYVNGVKQTEVASLSGINVDYGPLDIGPWYDLFYGAIDQLVIYDRTLSAAEVLAVFHSRLPGASASFTKSDSLGHLTEMRTAYEGRYLVTKFAYDSYGSVITSWDLGSGAAGANTTQFSYSSFYGGAYPTKMVRPDGKVTLTSFDRDLGAKLATLGTDCRLSRTEYDAAGRPVASSRFDLDSASKLIMDMEVPDGAALADLSCNGNLGTISGPVEVNGISGKARDFDGTDDYVQVADSASISLTSSFTVSAYVKADTLATGTRTVVSKIQSPYGFQFYVSPNNDPTYPRRLRLDLGNGASVASFGSSAQITEGTWHHVAAVFDDSANTIAFYIDGSSAGCTGSCSYTGTLADQSQPLRVGAKADLNVNNFDGTIDEVYLFNRPLTSTEVDSLSRLTFKLLARSYAAFDDMVATDGSPWGGYQFHGVTTYGPVSQPRRLYMDMETVKVTIGTTSYLEDLSGNGNHGKPTGATFVSTGGKVGGYYNFDPAGGDDHVRISSDGTKLNFTTEFTVAGWFKLNDVNNRWGISKWNSGTCTGSSYALLPAYGFTTGKPRFSVCGGGASDTVEGAASLPTGSWKFLAGTFDRGVMKLYIDGSIGTPVTKTSTIKRVQTGTARLTIGADSALSGGNGMNGGIDEVHIFPRALSTTEIQTLYNSYASPAAPTEKSHMEKHYFDGLGREVRGVARDTFGNKVETKADLFWNDNPQRSYLPSGWYHSFAYDFQGRTVVSTTPGDSTLQGVSLTNYLEKDRKVETIDPLGRRAYEKMDLLGQTVEAGVWNAATGAYGNLTKTSYNGIGLVVRSEDAKQQVTRAYYNMLGLVRVTIDPLGKASLVSYDDNLREVSRTDVMGRVLETTYDINGRVTRLRLKPSAESGTFYDATYGYDAADNLASIKNVTSSVYRQFDALHRLTREYLAMPASCPTSCVSNLSVQYAYDAANRVTDLTYQDGTTRAVYTYDSLSRPIQVDFGSTPTKQATFTYDTASRLDYIRYYEDGADIQLYEDYAYDVRDRITEVRVYKGATDHLKLTYLYDRASQIVHVDDNANTEGGVKAHDYVYDGNGLLTRATGPWGASEASVVIDYSYDAVGNILSKTDGGSATAYTYGSWNLLTSFGSTAFTYNDAGSPLTRSPSGGPTTYYTYDFTQRLVKLVVGADTHTYDYDGGGRRIKTVETVGGTTTRYWVFAGGQAVGYKEGTTNTFFVYLGGKLILRKTGTTDNRYYFQDLSENVRLVAYYAQNNVQVEAKYRYKPYGEVIVLTDSTAPVFKYAQQQLDKSGLYHMGARDYDPAIGRFLSRDPIGTGYSYGADNPISFGDPTGLTPQERLKAILPFVPGPYGAMLEPYAQTRYNSKGVLGAAEPPWYQPVVDWWQSLPFEWQFAISILIMIGLAILTAVTFGAAAPGAIAFAYGTFVAGFAFGVAVVGVGIATGRITDRQQAMDTFFTASMVGELAVGAGMAAARGAMWVGKALATRAEKAAVEAMEDGAGNVLARSGDKSARGGVYRLVDPETDQIMRTGRTGNLAQREAQHARDRILGRYKFEVVARSDDKLVQRGLEQMAHDFWDPPLDKINGIRLDNPNRDLYLNAASRFMQIHGGG